jgi:agmatine deiminase
MSRRLPAEWEPQSAIQFTFPHEDSDWAPYLEEVIPCFVAIIETVTRYQKALVACKDIENTKIHLINCNQDNLILVEIPSNDTWARDHGAITIMEDESPIILDFVFNGWGMKFAADKDNLITKQLFKKGILKSKKLQNTGLVLEGGGIESDGEGTILTTTECLMSLNRNPHLSKTGIEKKIKSLLGAERILWLNNGYLAGDDTDSHIDTLARFCDRDTIAYIQCLDNTDEHYSALAKMEIELKLMTKKDGTNYNLVPLPMTDPCYDEEGNRIPATYANFLIINGAVLVPTYRVRQDEQAIQILKSCFSNRDIIGLDCLPLIWQHGSLHCISMQYPKGVI